MFDNLTMEEVVDRLKEVRDNQKALKEQEDALKKRILADGRSEIKSENHTMKIQVRTKEVLMRKHSLKHSRMTKTLMILLKQIF